MARRKRSYGSAAKQHRGQAVRWGETFRAAVSRANEALRYRNTDSCAMALSFILNASRAGGHYEAERAGAYAPEGTFLHKQPARRKAEGAVGTKLRRLHSAYTKKCLPALTR